MCKCNELLSANYPHLAISIDVPDGVELLNSMGVHKNNVAIDKCIIEEIQYLWSKGIRTTGCCCGHNKVEPYIGVVDDDIRRMLDLGYKPQKHPMDSDRRDMFYPKTIKFD